MTKNGHFNDFALNRLRHESDPVHLWQKDKGQRTKFNTQLRDLGYNAIEIGSNATKLADVLRYLTQTFTNYTQYGL